MSGLEQGMNTVHIYTEAQREEIMRFSSWIIVMAARQRPHVAAQVLWNSSH